MWKQAILLAILVSCVDGKGEKANHGEATDTPEVAADGIPSDAGFIASDVLTLAAPETGTHLDDVNTDYQPVLSNPFAPVAEPRRESKRRSIELVLRSSPPGARASVDGKYVGITPTYWSGKADGKRHEFTFVKEQFRMARYRFVSTQSGVVHGTLVPLIKAPDAGVSAP